MFTEKPLLITAVGALIVGFIGGLAVSSLFPSARLGGGLNEAQIEKVKSSFPVILEIREFSGTVKGISGKTITLEIAESTNPFDEWPTTRKVTVADTTQIVRTSQKDPNEFQKEMEAYSSKITQAGGRAIDLYPLPTLSPLEEEIIQLSDIKSGDIITVQADHNIKMEAQFTAGKVSVGR